MYQAMENMTHGEPTQPVSEKPAILECPQFEYIKPFHGAPFRYLKNFDDNVKSLDQT